MKTQRSQSIQDIQDIQTPWLQNSSTGLHQRQGVQREQGAVSSLADEGRKLETPQPLSQVKNQPARHRSTTKTLKDLFRSKKGKSEEASSKNPSSRHHSSAHTLKKMLGIKSGKSSAEILQLKPLGKNHTNGKTLGELLKMERESESPAQELSRPRYKGESSKFAEQKRSFEHHPGRITLGEHFKLDRKSSSESQTASSESVDKSVSTEPKRDLTKLKDRLRLSTLKAPEQTQPEATVTTQTVADMAVKASRKIAGPDSTFYLLPPGGGKLHRYDPATDELVATGMNNIADIKSGPDGQLYALAKSESAGTTVLKLDRKGSVPLKESDQLQMQVDDKLHDLTFSKGGSELFALNAEGTLNYHNMHSSDRAAQPMLLPTVLASRIPRSIAMDSRGALWAVDEQSGVWKADAAKLTAITSGHSSESIDSVWQRIDSSLSGRLDSLETLPDGDVAVRDAQGKLYRANSNSGKAWEAVPFEMLSEPLFQRLHKALHASNSWDLLIFFGGTGSMQALDKKGLMNKLKHSGQALKKMITEDLPATYKNLLHFNYAKKQQDNPMSQYNKQLDVFAKILTEQKESVMTRLQNMPVAQKALNNGIGNDIATRAETLLDELIQDTNDPKIRKSLTKVPKGASVTGSQNILKQIKDIRTAMYGEQDSVAKKLNQLINDKIFINTDTTHKRGRFGEMIADHAILSDTAKRMVLEGENGNHEHEVTKAQTIQRADSLPHLIARSGIAKTDPLGNAAKAFESLQTIFCQDNDMLGRITKKYAPALGMTQENVKKPSVSDSAELFSRMINTMKPGESFKLGKSATNGFNTDTFRFVWSGVFKAMTDALAVSWLIPILDVGKLKGLELNMTKTEDGMTFEIKKSGGGFGQLGVRTGVGHVDLPAGSGPGAGEKLQKSWIFQGWEIALKGKYTRGVEDSIAFTVKDNGRGNIAEAVTSIMSGKADLFNLMRQSEEVKSTHTRSRDWDLNIGNVGVIAAGMELPNSENLEAGEMGKESAIAPNGKPLTAFVPEIAVNFKDKKLKSETVSSTGMVSQSATRQKFGLNDVRVNFIHANVLESDALKFPSPIELNGNDTGMNGRFGFPSILPGAILGKSFDRLAPVSKKVELHRDANGVPANINVDLTVSRSGTLLETMDKDGTLRRHIPGLRQALQTLLHQQGKSGFNMNKPVSVSLELKPEILKELPENPRARERQMQACAKDLSNFRITGLNVSQGHVGNSTKALPIPAVTRVRTANLSTDTNAGKVSFVYDKNQLMEHGQQLLHSLASFDDNVWGTSRREKRLTYIVSELNNLAQALGREPESFRNKGGSLVNSFRQQSQVHIDRFTRALRQTVLNPEREPDVEKGINALNTLATELDHVRQRFTSSLSGSGKATEFEGPAILTSGPLFSRTAGRMDESVGLRSHRDLDLEKTNEILDRLNNINLSAMRGRRHFSEKVGRITPWNAIVSGIGHISKHDMSSLKIQTQTPLSRNTATVRRDVDEIKRALNGAYDLHSGMKRDFLAKLDVLAVGKPDAGLVEELNGLLHAMTDNRVEKSAVLDS